VVRSLTEASEFGARPEIALLHACARSRIDTEQSRVIQALLQQEIDWADLIQLAARHRTIPLLYTSLAVCCPDAVPAEVMEQLQGYFRANGVRNLTMGRELLQVLRDCQDNGVRAVSYKGPLLAELVYGNLSLRDFYDLDLLVQRKDVARAKDTLISMGYQLLLPHRMSVAGHLAHGHDYTFWHARSKIRLELHWEIVERYFGFTLDPQLWDRLETVHFMGRQLLGLRAEDLLLILCVHGSKHGWPRLAWVCDFAELVRAHPTMDWDRVLWQARRHETQRMVLLGLSLAGDLLEATLPEDIEQTVQADPAVRSLGLEVWQRLFHEVEPAPGTSEKYRLFAFHIRLRKTLWGKVRHCLRVALVPTWEDWEAVPLPDCLSFLYYVVRPLRLLGKHVPEAWRRLRGRA